MATYREERIRRLAHEIWGREGHPHGRDAEHWRMATETYEAELANSRLDDAGKPIEEGSETPRERTMRTPAVATPTGAAANQPVTTRKRRTKAEMEAARAVETAAPPADRGRKPEGDAAPQVAETASAVTKRKRRTKAEMAAAAAGVVGAAAAIAAATVAVSKRRGGAKAETTGEAAPAPAADVALRRPRTPKSKATSSYGNAAPVAVGGDAALGARPDPSADGPSDVSAGVVPDPGAEGSPEVAHEAFAERGPDADPLSERVAD